MDPIKCLENVAACLTFEALDLSGAVVGLNEYYQWRVKGGLKPHLIGRGLSGDEFADQLATKLAEML
jgi:hypothetical protein